MPSIQILEPMEGISHSNYQFVGTGSLRLTPNHWTNLPLFINLLKAAFTAVPFTSYIIFVYQKIFTQHKGKNTILRDTASIRTRHGGELSDRECKRIISNMLRILTYKIKSIQEEMAIKESNRNSMTALKSL